MTANTSSSGGALLPLERRYDDELGGSYDDGISTFDSLTREDQDLELDVVLQSVVSAVTGIEGKWVRPRWQPEVANRPPLAQSWVAVGVSSVTADTFPYVQHTSQTYDEGYIYDDGNVFDPQDPVQRRDKDILVTNEDLEVFCSFYGQNATAYAARLRDGILLEQNRGLLYTHNMNLKSVGNIVNLPELVADKWCRRSDLTLTVRRAVIRTYPVYNVEKFVGALQSKPVDVTLTVETNS